MAVQELKKNVTPLRTQTENTTKYKFKINKIIQCFKDHGIELWPRFLPFSSVTSTVASLRAYLTGMSLAIRVSVWNMLPSISPFEDVVKLMQPDRLALVNSKSSVVVITLPIKKIIRKESLNWILSLYDTFFFIIDCCKELLLLIHKMPKLVKLFKLNAEKEIPL